MIFQYLDILQAASLIFISILTSSISPYFFFRKNLMIVGIISHGSLIPIVLSIYLCSIIPYISLVPSLFLLSGIVLLGIIKMFYSLSKVKYVKEQDLIIATMASAFAMGIFLMKLLIPANTISTGIFFGSIDLIDSLDVCQLMIATLIISIITYIFYPLYSILFIERRILKFSGINTNLVENLFILHSSIAIVTSSYIVGIIIVVALSVVPTMIASKYARSITDMFNLSFIISASSSIVSIIIARIIYVYGDISIQISSIIPILLALIYFGISCKNLKNGICSKDT